MRQQFSVGIMAGQVGNDFHTSEFVTVHSKTGDLRFVQIELERNAVKDAVANAVFLELFDSVHGKIDDPAQGQDGALQVLHLFRNEFQAVGRQVLGNRPPPPIVNQTTIGCDRYDPDPVGNGSC